MGYKAYPEYESSGDTWLGDVPRGWTVLRADFLCESIKKQISEDKLSGLEVFHYSIPVVQELGTGRIESGDEIDSAKLLIDQRQLLVSKLNPRKSTICLADKQEQLTVASGEFIQISSSKIDIKYAYYTWLSDKVNKLLSSRVQSVTRSHQRVAPEDIYKLNWAWPSRVEQYAIANFLDDKTAQIDRLIEKKQELIEKLQEQRSAIITMAVTKGVNAQVLTGPCTQEWLGDIPDHWKHNQKLNFLSTDDRNSFVNGPFGSDLLTTELVNEGVPVIYSGDVKETGFQRKSDKYVTEEKAKQLDFCRVDGGDILLAKVGDPPGDACIYPVDQPSGIVTQDVVRIKIDRNAVDAEYLCFLLNSKYGRHVVRLVSVEATRGRFSLADLKSIRHILPPLEEQQEIVLHIHQQLGRCNQLRDLSMREIETLQEYRTALITAAVTGQIDVRDWQAPAAAEEPEPDMEVA